MKNILLLFCLLFSSTAFSQDFEYKVNERPQHEKDDIFDLYNLQSISNYELIQALELSGTHIRKFSLDKFDRKYDLKVILTEYENGEKVNTKNISNTKNTYIHFTDSIPTDETTPYIDYIDHLIFYLIEKDGEVSLTFSTYGMSSHLKLKTKKDRTSQKYYIRTYRDYSWELHKDIPLFVYASSWYDSHNEVERFCGIARLSDDDATKELLTLSSHYYVISYRLE